MAIKRHLERKRKLTILFEVNKVFVLSLSPGIKLCLPALGAEKDSFYVVFGGLRNNAIFISTTTQRTAFKLLGCFINMLMMASVK